MLLRHSLDQAGAADRIESAVRRTLESGARTADLAATGDSEPLSTSEFGDAVLSHL